MLLNAENSTKAFCADGGGRPKVYVPFLGAEEAVVVDAGEWFL